MLNNFIYDTTTQRPDYLRDEYLNVNILVGIIRCLQDKLPTFRLELPRTNNNITGLVAKPLKWSDMGWVLSTPSVDLQYLVGTQINKGASSGNSVFYYNATDYLTNLLPDGIAYQLEFYIGSTLYRSQPFYVVAATEQIRGVVQNLLNELGLRGGTDILLDNAGYEINGKMYGGIALSGHGTGYISILDSNAVITSLSFYGSATGSFSGNKMFFTSGTVAGVSGTYTSGGTEYSFLFPCIENGGIAQILHNVKNTGANAQTSGFVWVSANIYFYFGSVEKLWNEFNTSFVMIPKKENGTSNTL